MLHSNYHIGVILVSSSRFGHRLSLLQSVRFTVAQMDLQQAYLEMWPAPWLSVSVVTAKGPSHNYLAMQHIIHSSGIQTSARAGHPSDSVLPSQQILVVVGSQEAVLPGSVSLQESFVFHLDLYSRGKAGSVQLSGCKWLICLLCGENWLSQFP